MPQQRYNLRNNQIEILGLKNTIGHNKKATENLINRMSETKERISELEYSLLEDTQLIRHIWKKI